MKVTKFCADARKAVEDKAKHMIVDYETSENWISNRDKCKELLENESIWIQSLETPVLLEGIYLGGHIAPGVRRNSQYLFQNRLYAVPRTYTEEEKALLIQNEFDKERLMFEKIRSKLAASKEGSEGPIRKRIPESVRIYVWRRDGAQCSRCGSRGNLEYDHIIPVTKGGSNTARNIELLCEKCNRAKHDKIV